MWNVAWAEEVAVGHAAAHLEHQVDGASVRGDGHRAALGGGLVGAHGVDRLGVGKRLDGQAVLLHQVHSCWVCTLEVACGVQGIRIKDQNCYLNRFCVCVYVHGTITVE